MIGILIRGYEVVLLAYRFIYSRSCNWLNRLFALSLPTRNPAARAGLAQREWMAAHQHAARPVSHPGPLWGTAFVEYTTFPQPKRTDQ